jgi:glycerophosphoryl diester phosphodiesterase
MRRAIVARIPSMLARSGARLLMLHHAVVSRAAIEKAHGLGAAVWAWTVDVPLEVERLDAAGVDAVITNDPRVFSDRATLRS